MDMEIRGAPSALCCTPAMIFGHSRARIVHSSLLYESTSWLILFDLLDSGRNDILMISPWNESKIKSCLYLLSHEDVR